MVCINRPATTFPWGSPGSRTPASRFGNVAHPCHPWPLVPWQGVDGRGDLGEETAWASLTCPGERRVHRAPFRGACVPCLEDVGRGRGEDWAWRQGAALGACLVWDRASAPDLGEPSEVAPRGLQGVTACFAPLWDPLWNFLEGHFLLKKRGQKVALINI